MGRRVTKEYEEETSTSETKQNPPKGKAEDIIFLLMLFAERTDLWDRYNSIPIRDLKIFREIEPIYNGTSMDDKLDVKNMPHSNDLDIRQRCKHRDARDLLVCFRYFYYMYHLCSLLRLILNVLQNIWNKAKSQFSHAYRPFYYDSSGSSGSFYEREDLHNSRFYT